MPTTEEERCSAGLEGLLRGVVSNLSELQHKVLGFTSECPPYLRSSTTRENVFLIKVSTTCYSWGGRVGTVKLCRGSECTSHWRTVRECLWLHAWI